MFLNPENLINDIKSTTSSFQKISDYHIFEIFVTRNNIEFVSYDTDAYNLKLWSLELFKQLESICNLKINSLCFSSSAHCLDIDIYSGEGLNINIFESEDIRLRNIDNMLNEGRFLSDRLRDDIINCLNKEFPLFFTVSNY